MVPYLRCYFNLLISHLFFLISHCNYGSVSLNDNYRYNYTLPLISFVALFQMFLSMTSNRQQWLQVAVAVFLSSCCLCPAGAIRALSYNERIAAISRQLPHNQHRNSHDREVIADFKRFLETLSHSLVQDALLESVRILTGSEYSHVKFDIGGALQVNETDVCLNHTAAVIIGVIEKEGWALQSGCSSVTAFIRSCCQVFSQFFFYHLFQIFKYSEHNGL